jgi:uncharacterized iron-regulated membrane protein
MEPTFRQSMNVLHTWTGVIVGALLFAVFWMGTLSVFDREIDRWMMPETRLAASEKPVSFDALRAKFEAEARMPLFWFVQLPTDRDPLLRLVWRGAGRPVLQALDPSTGAKVPNAQTLGATRFIYPFHYNLNLKFWDIGVWLVGFAAMAMLVLVVSGVVIHRRIFADFFTFRRKKLSRSILDVHNIAGVLGLPFHFAITLSGLAIFYAIFFSSWQVAYSGDLKTYNREAFDTFSRPKLNRAGDLGSLDAVAAEARRLWGGADLMFMFVWHPGDAGSYVEVRRSFADSVTAHLDIAYFDGTSGSLLHRAGTKPVKTVQRFIAGMHYIQFRHWTLRWLYFSLGAMGCVLIATGFLFWADSRRKKYAQLGLSGVRVVDALAVGSTTGIIVATLGFFVINSLLPLGATFAGYERAALEIWFFYLVWLVTFGHAWLRPSRAWIEQCWLIAGFAASAVLLNWITTGDHLVRSLTHIHLWPVGGMDLTLLAAALIAVLTAYKLQRRAAATSGHLPSVRADGLQATE